MRITSSFIVVLLLVVVLAGSVSAANAVVQGGNYIGIGNGPSFKLTDNDWANGETSLFVHTLKISRPKSTNDFAFSTSGDGKTFNERMRLTSDGKLGIGTSTPHTSLEVPLTGFQIGSSSTSSDNFHLTSDTNGGSRGLRVWNGNYGYGSLMMSILSSGKVGIGTLTPGYQLEIEAGDKSFGEHSLAGFDEVASGRGVYLGYLSDGSQVTHAIVRAGGGADLSLGTYNQNQAIIILEANGNVGIGMKPDNYKLDVNGWIRSTGIAKASDARLKNVFGEYNAGLKEIKKLNPVYYEYKKDNALGLLSGVRNVGLVAQDVQMVLPEAVSKDNKGYLSVNNEPIVLALVNAVQEQQKEIELLKQQCK